MAAANAIEVCPPRLGLQEFFLGVGVVEITVGLATLLLADFVPLFTSLTWVLGIGGFAVLLVCILNSRATKIYDLFAASLLVAYGSGALNSVVAYANGGEDLLSAALVPEYWLTRTLSLVGVACGCLHLAGRLDRDGYLFRGFSMDAAVRDRTLLLAIIVLSAYAWLVLTGTIGFRGNVLEGDAQYRVSGTASIVLMLATPVGALAMSAMLLETRRLRAALLAITGTFLLIAQLGLGRRVFIFSLLTYALTMLAFKPPKRLFTLKNIGIALAAIILLKFATSFFYAMRIADTAQTGTERAGMIQLLPKAMEIYWDDNSELQDKISTNLKSRTFVLQYLADISQREAEIGPLLGLNTLRAAVFATPNVLYPGKYFNPLFIQEESLINPYFLLPVIDSANSIFTAGTADFGACGLLLYPLLLCIGCSLINSIFRRTTSPMAALLLSLFLAQSLMSVENDLSYYFSAVLRAAAITVMAAVFFYPRRKPSQALPKPSSIQREHR